MQCKVPTPVIFIAGTSATAGVFFYQLEALAEKGSLASSARIRVASARQIVM